MSIDFLIVGGGIGGAVLANLLGRRGKRVVVLERNRTPVLQTWPEILWPATVQVLRSIIPAHQEEQWARFIQAAQVIYKRKILLRFDNELFERVGFHPCSTANTRHLLLQQAPCECQRGVEVQAVLKEQGRVVGIRARDTATGTEREMLADWTVGDDGAHSVIRSGCGLPMMMRRFPLDLLSFAFDWPADVPDGMVRLWINEDRLRSGVLGLPTAPMPQGRGAALLPVWPEVFDNGRSLQQAIAAFRAQDPQLAEVIGERSYPHGIQRIRLAWGVRPCFGVPGAVLIGDAAHPVTPAGGQGANSSVADALVLAEAALERPAQLLEEYVGRRKAAVQRSLAISRAAARVASMPRLLLSVGLTLVPWMARWLNSRPATFAGFLRFAAEAFQERSSDAPQRGVTPR